MLHLVEKSNHIPSVYNTVLLNMAGRQTTTQEQAM